jgi:hypothetical protein
MDRYNLVPSHLTTGTMFAASGVLRTRFDISLPLLIIPALVRHLFRPAAPHCTWYRISTEY